MIRKKMPLLATAAVLGLLALAGCGGQPESADAPPAVNAPAEGMSGNAPGAAAEQQTGQQVYTMHCQGCHGATGEGVQGSGPSLAQVDEKPDDQLRQTILNGHEKMPAFKAKLSEEEVTEVVAYVKGLAPDGGGGAAH